MQFTIGQDVFKAALTRALGVADKKPSIPIFGNVMIETLEGGKGIRVSASDMDMVFAGEYDAKVIEHGVITAPAKQLHSIVKNAPEESIHVIVKENECLEITSGKYWSELPGLSADGFMSIPDLSTARIIRISATALRDMIDNTLFSAATDDSRYGLNGCFLEMVTDEDRIGGESTIKMVSTDGHRLSICSRIAQVGDEGIEDYIMSRKSMKQVLDLCAEFESDDVDVLLTSNSATFRHGRMMLFSRLLEGDFPDYRQVLPGSRLRRAIVPRDNLVRALDRMQLTASDKTYAVRFQFSDRLLTVSSSSPDQGKSRETVAIELQGEPFEVGYNAKYVIEALSKCKNEEVAIDMQEALNPARISDIDCTDTFYIVMPMRME